MKYAFAFAVALGLAAAADAAVGRVGAPSGGILGSAGDGLGVLGAPPGGSGGGGGSTAVEINFSGYPVNLDDHADWVVQAGAMTVTNGETTGNLGGTVSLARYVGRPFSANQAVEVTFGSSTAGTGGAHGCAVRLQSGATSGYYLFVESGAGVSVYFGIVNAGAHTYPFSSTATGTNGTKLRLEVTGAGTATRLTAKMNDGGGWVTISGMGNMDPGVYFDAGAPGITGYSNELFLWITHFHAEP